MSTVLAIASIVAAIAAVGYLLATVRMVRVMSAAMEQQKRVAELMELDLRSRVAPNIRFHALGGNVKEQRGEIKNEGKGTAINVHGYVMFYPSNRKADFNVHYWMETEKSATFDVGLRDGEDRFEVVTECDDTIGFNHYTFRSNAAPTISRVREPR